MELSFNDIQGLQSITALSRSDRNAALDQVARQFESFFVSQMLKGMRAANAIFSADDPLQTHEMEFRQQMLDEQLSVSLTQGRGLGLAAVFARQLRQQFGSGDAADSPSDAPAEEPGFALHRRERAVPMRVPARARYQMPAPPAAAALPAVVRNALELLEPLTRGVRDGVPDNPSFPDKKSFVAAIAAHARAAAHRLGLDHRVLLAQAALETGWGQSIIEDNAGRSSRNLFNIKAGSYWTGPSVGVTTLEFHNGVPRPERARFRAYGSFAESFGDYVDTLRGDLRYRRALAQAAEPERYLRGLAEAGYATDPDYADKILRLLRDPAIAEAP